MFGSQASLLLSISALRSNWSSWVNAQLPANAGRVSWMTKCHPGAFWRLNKQSTISAGLIADEEQIGAECWSLNWVNWVEWGCRTLLVLYLELHMPYILQINQSNIRYSMSHLTVALQWNALTLALMSMFSFTQNITLFIASITTVQKGNVWVALKGWRSVLQTWDKSTYSEASVSF